MVEIKESYLIELILNCRFDELKELGFDDEEIFEFYNIDPNKLG
jgi:hypothetical protein